MLPKINPANDNVGSNAAEEKRSEIFNKISESLRTSTVKPISDTIVAKIVSSFADSLQETNKDLLETLLEEDKKLLKETVDAISKLQGKNQEELDKILALAERLILSGQTSKNRQLQGVGEKLKETALQGKYEAAGATLTGEQDTLKNRFIRSMTGTTPAQAQVQGTTVFGHLKKTSSRAFREGMGSIFVSDEERREDIRRQAERENKQIALAQQSASEFGKILDSSGKTNNNSPDNSSVETNGEEVTNNLTNPQASVDTATRSDAQELAAGIRDTDPAFSRATTQTVDPWEKRWKDLMDLLGKIKDCVCECQCEGGSNYLPETGPRVGRRAARAVKSAGVAAGVAAGAVSLGALAVGGVRSMTDTISSGASNLWNWGKEKLGIGKNKGSATPVRSPSVKPLDPIRKGVPVKPAANDRGVRINPAANDDAAEILQNKKRVNEPYWQQDQKSPEIKKPDSPQQKTTAPRIEEVEKPSKVNAPVETKPPSNVVEFRRPETPIANEPVAGKPMPVAPKRTTPLTPANDNMKPWYERAWEGTKKVAGSAKNRIQGGVTAAKGMAGRGWDALKSGTNTAWQGTKKVAGSVSNTASRGWNAFKGGAERVGSWSANTRVGKAVVGLAESKPAQGISKLASRVANSGVAKWGGRLLGTAAVGLDAYNRRKEGQSWGKVGSGIGGGLAGAALGAKGGAALGGAIGSAFFGVGAAPGAAIGGFLGGVGGYIAGSGAGDWIYDKVTGKAEPVQKPMQRANIAPAIKQSNIVPQTRTAAGLETGRNLDSSFIERGTAATSKPPVINVPPPTVIQAPPAANSQESNPFNIGRDYMETRVNDSSWLRFQEKRAVA